MSPEPTVSAPQNEEELQAFIDILVPCFQAPESLWKRWADLLGDGNIRVVRREGRVVGGTGILEMGQWFGGRVVPMSGICAVGISPEARGTGAAKELMVAVLRDGRERGLPISTLHASAQRLYRSIGYEQAGSIRRFSAPATGLPTFPRDLPLRKADPEDFAQFREMRREWCRRGDGPVDRNRALWGWVVASRRGEKLHAYVAGPEDAPEGYVIFFQQSGKEGYDLVVRDFVALTPAALRRLLTLLADHRSLAGKVSWCGPPVEPAFALFDERTWEDEAVERWMLRVTDVRAALEARGYPLGVKEELHLEVHDALIRENDGPWLVKVEGGRACATRGGLGRLRLDVKALAPLYTGFFTPTELARLGWLEADEEPLVRAARVFAGREPWLTDWF